MAKRGQTSWSPENKSEGNLDPNEEDKAPDTSNVPGDGSVSPPPSDPNAGIEEAEVQLSPANQAVQDALDEYQTAQKKLASAELVALSEAIEGEVRVPKVGENIEFYIEGEDMAKQAIAAKVLFVHSAYILTLVASKHEGARHTHANVRFGTKTGNWNWRH